MVISQTWLNAGEAAFDAYRALVNDYDDFLHRQPGFVSRKLVRSIDDPKHIVHLREFDSVESYEAMTQIPEYRDQIEALSQFVDPAAYPPGAVGREYCQVIVDTIA